jgi:hypothetical protein
MSPWPRSSHAISIARAPGPNEAQEPHQRGQRARGQRFRVLEQPAQRAQVAMTRQRTRRGQAHALGAAHECVTQHAARTRIREQAEPPGRQFAPRGRLARDQHATLLCDVAAAGERVRQGRGAREIGAWR